MKVTNKTKACLYMYVCKKTLLSILNESLSAAKPTYLGLRSMISATTMNVSRCLVIVFSFRFDLTSQENFSEKLMKLMYIVFLLEDVLGTQTSQKLWDDGVSII